MKYFLALLLICIHSSMSAQSYKQDRLMSGSSKGLDDYSIHVIVGSNKQFLDHPAFKLRSDKHSMNDYMLSLHAKNFGLEIEKRLHDRRFNLIGGLYYSEANMGTTRKQQLHDGHIQGLSIIEERVGFVSAGLGLQYTLRDKGRWRVDYSLIPTISYYTVSKLISDTAALNYSIRKSADSFKFIFPENDTRTIYHPQTIQQRFGFRIKNKISITYFFNQKFGMSIQGVYNLGLPNQGATIGISDYSVHDWATPISTEIGVFSNSSLEMNFGFTYRLKSRKKYL